MKRVALLLVLLAAPVSAQVLVFNGGDSTQLGAAGGQLQAYFLNHTITLSGGVLNGHVIYGASEQTMWRKYTLTFGDNPFGVSLPGAGVYTSVRGVSISRDFRNDKIMAFAGSTGDFFSPGFLTSITPKHLGAGVYWRHQFPAGSLYTLAVDNGAEHTLLEGGAYQWRRVLALEGSGGLFESKPFLDGQITVNPTHWSGFTVAHENYFGDGRITVNSLGASVSRWIFSGHTTYFRSNTVTGLGYGVGAHLGAVQVEADRYTSKFGATTGVSALEHLTPRLYVNEFVSETNGHWSSSFGGGFLSNHFTVDVSQTTLFMPLYVGRSPFQQTLSVNLSLPLPRGTRFHLGTTVDPTGKLRFTTDGTAYANGPFAFGSTPDHTTASHTAGKYVITGRVVDTQGQPVDGAALQIGKETVYTDDTGSFFLRVRHQRTYTLAVLLDQFIAPGNWRVTTAPPTVEPGEPALVTLTRQP